MCLANIFDAPLRHTQLIRLGESGLGKTTLINTLFSTELSPAKNYSRRHYKSTSSWINWLKSRLLRPSLRNVSSRSNSPSLTPPDSETMSTTAIHGSQLLSSLTTNLKLNQHEAYMCQEQQPQRHEKTDLRVHACVYFIRPTGHTYVYFSPLIVFLTYFLD